MSDKVNGVYYQCNLVRYGLSDRIAQRNMPSRPLQPQFSMRPVSTKYALLPIIDRRAPATIQFILSQLIALVMYLIRKYAVTLERFCIKYK